MKTDLVKYLKERYDERNTHSSDPGPVVTISRDCGCSGRKVSELLTDTLNQRMEKHVPPIIWRWVGKEIFMEAAKEMDLDPEMVEHVMEEKRGVLDEILSSQATKFYKNDKTVINTFAEVIRSMARHGHVIILGRGGDPLTRDFAKSLHIYLEAPLEWRVNIICERMNFKKLEDAQKYVLQTDKKRQLYREHFEGKGNDYTWVDVKFNCMTLTTKEIVDAIINLMQSKKLI